MSVRVIPASLLPLPFEGHKAWAKVINRVADLDLGSFSGYAIKSRFRNFSDAVQVYEEEFLFAASMCLGAPDKPRYRYCLVYNPGVREGESGEQLYNVGSMLEDRLEITGRLQACLSEHAAELSPPLNGPDFPAQAAYAIATNTIYRAAAISWLVLTGYLTLGFDADDAVRLTPSGISRPAPPPEPPPPPPPPVYRPGMRRRLIDRPKPKEEFPP